MRSWNEIVNKASLGSAKLPLTTTDLPAEINDQYELADTGDVEENFLLYSSLAYQFRQAGSKPLDLRAVTFSQAEAEDKPYCSSAANAALKSVLSEELPPFIEMWLKLCVSKDRLVHPEMLPTLLDIAQKKRELRKLVMATAGRRGEWLAKLNPQWTFSSSPQDAKAVWDTGTFEDRKEILRVIRSQDATEGLSLLQSTWATEGANEKLAFAEILRINLSAGDLSWLEGLKEKSQKINSLVLDLLKSIPGSAIISEYKEVLKKMLNVKTSKALLGIVSKTTLEIDDRFAVPPSIFKSGIEKMSSDKDTSDAQHIVAQLISFLPPSFLNEHFGIQAKDILELFKKEKNNNYIVSVSRAAARHRDVAWAVAILDAAGHDINPESREALLMLVPEKERDRFAAMFFVADPVQMGHMILRVGNEWSVELAKTVLKHAAGEIYHFNKNFFRPAAVLIPVSLLDSLDSFEPSEEQKKVYWKTQRDELARLLILKKQILQSFNA